MTNNYIFIFLFFIIFNCAIFVLFSKNTIYSILFLILLFFFSSFLLMFLKVEFLSIIFIMIYVGAIAVLFLFVIMMLNLRIIEIKENRFNYIFISSFILFFFLFEFFFLSYNFIINDIYNFYDYKNWINFQISNFMLKNLAYLLYIYYSFLIIIVILILFSVLVGILLIIKKK